jgi:ATP adenylyltransferase
MLNLYPYTNGHLLIAPLRHAASPSGVAPETRAEVMELMVRAEEAVRAEYRPGGLNVGMNLGRPAGAGVEGHFHVHLVPRWIGDTNFLTVAAETRVLSETLGATWRKLRRRLRDGGAAPGSGPRRRRRSA